MTTPSSTPISNAGAVEALLAALGAESFGHNAPALRQLQEREVVREVARMNRALELDEGGLRPGKVDGDDAVSAFEPAGLGRGAALDQLQPISARQIANPAILQTVKVAHLVEGLVQLGCITLVQSIEIGPHHALNRFDIAYHRHSTLQPDRTCRIAAFGPFGDGR